MAGDFLSAQNKSVEILQNKIAPLLKEKWNYEMISAENSCFEINKILDIDCGIDFLLKNPSPIYVFGAASRIQICSTPYNTFTVRFSRESGAVTEFSKRILAIEKGAMYPQLTLQAYVSPENEVISAAIIRTTELFDYIQKNNPTKKRTSLNQIGQAEFYVCKWDDIESKGFKVTHLI